MQADMKINGHTFVHSEESAPDPGTLSDRERLVISMAELAKVNRELREVRKARNEFAVVLQADIERLELKLYQLNIEHEVENAEPAILPLREALRRSQKALAAANAQIATWEAANTIDDSIADASADELELIQRFTAKLMGEGRHQYGRLDLSRDARTPEEFREEALDEGCDAVAYLLMAMMSVER